MGTSMLLRACEMVDDLPVAPNRLATAAIDRFSRARQSRAARDPQWAQIEDRRHDPDRPHIVTMLSEDLTQADWTTQDRIAERLTPDPWWLPIARTVQHAHLTRAVGWARARRQRARRGWADVDTYDLGRSMAGTLGAQLLHMADTTHGWPAGDEFPTFDVWVAALRAHGTTLVTYANGNPQVEAALDRWYEIAVDPDADPASERALFDAHTAAEVAEHEQVTAAWRWVADHHASLWT